MSTTSTPITEFSSEMNIPSGISDAFDVDSFLNWDDSPASIASQQLSLDNYATASHPSSASSTSLQLEPDTMDFMMNPVQVTGPGIFQQYSDSDNSLGIDFATLAQGFNFTFDLPAPQFTVAPSSLHSNDASPSMTPEMTRTNSNASKRSAETDESDEQPRKRPGRPRKTSSVPSVNKSKPVQNAHATKLIHDKFYKNGRAERDTGLSRKVLDGFHTAEQLLAAIDSDHLESTKQLLEDAEEQRVKSRIDGQAQRAKVKKAKEELTEAKEQAESKVLDMKTVIAAYLAGQVGPQALKDLL